MIKLHTTLGVISLELDHARAPATAANFLQYTREGFYDGTLFHRVIPNFMIQGGGLGPDMNQKSARPSIRNEAGNGLKNQIGTVAMARTSDPQSATAQFFINVKDNAALDYKSSTPQGWGYAVFGKVTGGTDVVDKIAKVATGRRGFHDDVPKDDVVIEKAVAL